MKWIRVKGLHSIITAFNLVQEDGLKVTLKFNPLQKVVRLGSDARHAVISIERSGGFNNKTILYDQYGQLVGKLS
jgi:hypothetical protein